MVKLSVLLHVSLQKHQDKFLLQKPAMYKAKKLQQMETGNKQLINFKEGKLSLKK